MVVHTWNTLEVTFASSLIQVMHVTFCQRAFTTVLCLSIEPPKSEELPNLVNLLDTLDGGESDLETETEPPHLFLRPEQEPNYREISHLETTLKDELIDPYVDRFDDSIQDEVLMIGNISLEEVQVLHAKIHFDGKVTKLISNIERKR